MKQVFQNPKSGKTRTEEITPPPARRGGVFVKNFFSVISVGTERNIIELSKKSLLQKAKERPDYVQKFFMLIKTKGFAAAWRVAQSKLATDIALGYSSAGEVLAVGDDVEEFKTGDRIACAGQDYASHAEYVFVPKNLCAKIPAGVADDEAAFATLGAIAMQGIRRAELAPGETVGVVGMGLLGQISARMLKAYGHPVVGFDVNPAQVKFATTNGLDAGVVLGKDNAANAVARFTRSRGLDAVIIYASTKSDDPLKLAVQIVRDRGRIVQVGNILSNIPWRDFIAKELTYHSSRSYGPGRYDRNYEERGNDYPLGYVRWTERRNLEEFLRLLADKRLSVKNLITRTFDIAEAEKAYELVFRPQGLVHGILLRYPKEGKPGPTFIRLREGDRASNIPLEKPVINIGLVGIGSFMKSTIIPHLKEIEGVRVAAVAHTKGLPAKELANELGAEYVTSEYKRLIEDKNIDLIICATRHSSHAKIAKDALSAGKSLYIEKPLALNEQDLREVMEVARKSRGKLLVGFNRRFSHHLIEARKEFEDASTPLNILYRVNAGPLEASHWSYDPNEGGRILGEACHFVHALQYLTGSLPKRLWTAAIPAEGAIAHEENFALTVEYENGSLGTVFYSALGNFRLPKEYLEIYGDGKIMAIDNFKDGRVIYPSKTKTLDLRHQDKGYTREMELFIKAIKDGTSSPMPLEEIHAAHIASFAMMESLKTGKPISFSGGE